MERIRRHLSYANVAATLALVFAMTGGAVAATGGFSSGGTLRACANEEGRLKLLKSGERCKRGQKSVSWNQTGPPGAPGAKGVAGAPGVAGSNGAAGTNGQNGASAVNLWARVAPAISGGGLEAGSGVTGVKPILSGTEVEVTFNRDVHNCGAVATLDIGPANKIYASSFGAANDNTIFVAMLDDNGLNTGGFTLAITC